VAVATLGTIYSVGDVEGAGLSVLEGIVRTQWSLATGLSFLAWYVFAPQCVATLGVVKRETNSWTWPTVMFVYMVALAYLASFITYNAAKALGWG
jgi:ferrous iron transport protein B